MDAEINTPQLLDTYSEAEGFLFIGDPHITSVQPGRRKEKDYADRILKKLDWCIGKANELNYVVVLLGDLLDRPVEPDEGLKARLRRVLSKARHPIVYLLGNHERSQKKLTDNDSLTWIAETTGMQMITLSGAHRVFQFGERRFGLGGTPHGQVIPTDVTEMFPPCDAVIWLTHHDLAFEKPYPRSIPLHEIKGCALVVNGHMHMAKKPEAHGKTKWFNPGNINRQSIDARDHKLRVYGFDAKGSLTPYDVPHEKDVFDLTGWLVDAIRDEDQTQRPMSEQEALEAAFVQVMEAEAVEDYARTQDGSVIREMIERQFEARETDQQVRNLVLKLLKDEVEAEAA